MRYEFNIHVETVYHVEVESDGTLAQAVDKLMDSYAQEKLELGEGDEICAEFWEATEGYQVGEFNAWESGWQIEDDE